MRGIVFKHVCFTRARLLPAHAVKTRQSASEYFGAAFFSCCGLCAAIICVPQISHVAEDVWRWSLAFISAKSCECSEIYLISANWAIWHISARSDCSTDATGKRLACILECAHAADPAHLQRRKIDDNPTHTCEGINSSRMGQIFRRKDLTIGQNTELQSANQVARKPSPKLRFLMTRRWKHEIT